MFKTKFFQMFKPKNHLYKLHNKMYPCTHVLGTLIMLKFLKCELGVENLKNKNDEWKNKLHGILVYRINHHSLSLFISGVT